MEETTKQFYSMREACSLLEIHPNTLRRWDKEGKIKAVRPEGGQRRIPGSEIKRLQTKTTQPASPSVSHPSNVSAASVGIDREVQLSHFLEYVFAYHKDDWGLVKRAIMIRDEYTCSRCGLKELLGVHHKNGTSRNDPDNLETLCQKCYKDVHGASQEQKKVKIHSETKKEISETPKIEIRHDKPKYESGEVPRHVILDDLSPAGLTQRTAFGDLLSAATALRRFTLEQVAAKARCPTAIASTFCERMGERGYIATKEKGYEMRAVVGT